jgi:hypothetical protein
MVSLHTENAPVSSDDALTSGKHREIDIKYAFDKSC